MFQQNAPYFAFCRKNPLRLVSSNRRTPLTGGAEMHWRGAGRDGRSGTTGSFGGGKKKKSEVEGRARRKFRALLLLFVSTLFEIDISEEICGRFGSVRWIRRLYINATRISVR